MGRQDDTIASVKEGNMHTHTYTHACNEDMLSCIPQIPTPPPKNRQNILDAIQHIEQKELAEKMPTYPMY